MILGYQLVLIVYLHFFFTAEAENQYGADNIKIYRSSFGNMYFAVTTRKQKTVMKLVCAGPEQKVQNVFIFQCL